MTKDIKSNNSLLKKFKNQKKQFLILEGIVFVLLVGYIVGAIYFNNRYLPGTKIDNVDVAGLTKEGANDKLAKSVSKKPLSLLFNDGKKETIDASALNVQFNKNNTSPKVLSKQNSLTWIAGIFTSTDNIVDDLITVSDEDIKNSINTLQHAQAANQAAPQNAAVVYKDKNFVIEKEQTGSTLEMNKLVSACKEAIVSGKETLDVAKSDCYVQPTIKSTEEGLQSQLKIAKEHCNASITYKTASGKTFTLDGTTMASWLVKGEDGSYSYDEATFKANLKKYIENVALSYNSVGQARTFTGADGAQHNVTGGNYGVRILPDAEVTEVMSEIKANKVDPNRTPKTTGLQATAENGGLGGTFVEVSITKQHVWYHKNGSVIMESDCVSGRATDADRATPTGTYYVYMKQRNRVLRGTKLPNGQWPYETPVKYWMPFNKGIGLHDLNRSAYGGSVYINNGSHGCINLPTSFAASLYEQIEVNTPVVVYK